MTRDASGAGDATSVFASRIDMSPSQWTPDGRTLLFTAAGQRVPGNADAVWALDLASGKATEILNSAAGVARFGQVSPDGRWIAFSSQQNNRSEVYIHDYPGLKGRWQVSTRGGLAPRWRRDGAELFFLDYDSRLLAVSVTAADSSVTLGTPTVLFGTDMGHHTLNRTYSWDVDPAGERFYTLEPIQADDDRPPMVLVRSWTPPKKPR